MIKALILAGGKGARLRPLALHIPKPIVPLANIPFLFFQIDRIKLAEITEIILSLSYQPRKIIDIFGDGMQYGVTMRYSHEDLPLGTAGAFKAAENLIDDTTIVLNGDILTNVDLLEVLRFHRKKKAEATFVTTRVMNPSGYGLVETKSDNRIVRFTEKPPEDEVTGDMINAGIYILERSALDRIPSGGAQSFERELFPAMAQEGVRIFAYPMQGFWQDIGSPAKYLEASFGVISGRVRLPRYPHNSCRLNDWEKSKITIDAFSMMDGKCVVKPDVTIENSVLGEGCRIEEGARLKDSVIWSGTRILPGARVERSIVGRQCYIGEGARLRPGTVLGDKSSVSDFSIL
jgi:NDP-sugar pyrophosphorylase family protein